MSEHDAPDRRDAARYWHPPGSELTVEVERLIAGRYRIRKRLARGGQAAVYLAHQEPLDRPVALKVLVPPPDADEEEIQRFQDRFLLEARTLATLVHPNIVVVHDYGEINPGCYYIAMEYVPGKRFSDVLRERPVDRQRLLNLIYQTCAALHYAHRRGVIHRDVKNSNILVRTDETGAEQVKVVDFGIAKLMEHDPELTQVGVILGSPHFMAPEQAQGSQLDHRTDLYAVGVLLYRALINRYPFDGPNSTAILTAHIMDELPFFAVANPKIRIHPALEQIVRRALAKRPEDRFQDMSELMAALKPWVDGSLPIRLPQDGLSPADTTIDPETSVETRAPTPNTGPTDARLPPTPIKGSRAPAAGAPGWQVMAAAALLALLLVVVGVVIGIRWGEQMARDAAPEPVNAVQE